MQESIARSVRLPLALVETLESRAAAMGLTFNDLVADILLKEVGAERNPATVLLVELRSWLHDHYKMHNFPQDVTLQLFRAIRGDRELLRLYQAAIKDEAGKRDEHRKAALHRRIGKMVKMQLDAEVVGRSPLLDREVELIESYAFLKPTRRRP